MKYHWLQPRFCTQAWQRSLYIAAEKLSKLKFFKESSRDILLNCLSFFERRKLHLMGSWQGSVRVTMYLSSLLVSQVLDLPIMLDKSSWLVLDLSSTVFYLLCSRGRVRVWALRLHFTWLGLAKRKVVDLLSMKI